MYVWAVDATQKNLIRNLSGFSTLNITAAHLAFVHAEFSSNARVPTGTATLAEFRKK
jgi:hypothetical protein